MFLSMKAGCKLAWNNLSVEMFLRVTALFSVEFLRMVFSKPVFVVFFCPAPW